MLARPYMGEPIDRSRLPKRFKAALAAGPKGVDLQLFL
jgi:hypothetical protein